MVEEPFDHSSFSRNRARLLAHEVAHEFFAAVLAQARALNLLSDEHFSVDGTQIEAWASRKSYGPKDPPAGGGDAGSGGAAPGQTLRLRDRYQSITDLEARMYRKSKADKAQLCYLGNALMDNQHGLLADFTVGLADGFCERSQALGMLARLKRRALSVGARTRLTTLRASSQDARRRASRRASRKTSGVISAPRSIRRCWTPRATAPVSGRANGSKRSSAGSRPSPTSARPDTAAARRPNSPRS